MKEIQINSRLVPELNKLSEFTLALLLNLSRSFLRMLFRIGRSMLRQIRFLRQFDYSKASIQAHLLAKAGAFFGFSWEEETLKAKPKKRTFGQKIANRIRRDRVSRTESRALKLKKVDEKMKKMSKNLYRAP